MLAPREKLALADYDFHRDQARAIALDPAQHHRVEEEAIKSADAGVRSVPHFVFGGSIAINGGRSEDEIVAAIQAASGAISLWRGFPKSNDPELVGDDERLRRYLTVNV